MMQSRNGTRGVRMNDFLKDIIKTTGNEYTSLVADGVEAGDVDNFIAVSYTHLTLPTISSV